jgi:hypothetical protein
MSDVGPNNLETDVLDKVEESEEPEGENNTFPTEKNKKVKWFVSFLKERGFLNGKNTLSPRDKVVINKKNLKILNVENSAFNVLSDDFDPDIEQQAIDSIEPQELQILSSHKSSRIRAAVAFNPMTTCPVLQKLAIDVSDAVRFNVVRNTSTSEKIIKILLDDPDEKIKIRARARSNTTPVEILMELSQDQDVEIRRKVALNQATPLEILENLAKDPDKAVSTAAHYKIKKLKKKTGKLG